MDRILLVHPLGYDSIYAGQDIARLANLMPPLGLASLSAYLQEAGIEADIIDCFARPNSLARIREYVRSYRPGFIGVTCTTSGFPNAVEVIKAAKQERPRLRAVIGGAHPSALKTEVLNEQDCIDYAVVGEGERPLLDLIRSKGQGVGRIPGVCYREDGQAVFNGPQSELVRMDDLPFPAYDQLYGFPDTYTLPVFNYPRRPNTSCISSRGCPYKCSYCDRSVFGSTFRYNSPDYLYAHMLFLSQRWGIRHINFYDDQFTLNRQRVVELCSMLIDSPLGMTFNCAARAEHVDTELLAMMRAAGCWMISLGIENGNQKLLSRHRQNADLDMVAEKVAAIKRAGIRVKGLFMLGLPGESEQSIQDTKDYARSLNLDDLNLAKFTPFPGSRLYTEIKAEGGFDEDYARMDCMHFLFIPEGLTEEVLEQRFQEFYKEHFSRPRTLWNYITMLWRSPDSWKRFLASLPDFLRFARKGKRIDRKRARPKKDWTSRSLGGRWQHRFFYLLIGWAGPRLAYTFLYPLSLWYVLLYPRVRQRIRPYLRQRFPGQKGLILDLGRMYWLSLNFAQVLVDRASLGILGPDRFKIDFPDRDRFLELMGRDSGFILINSHVGSWQVAISAFEGLRRPVSMLMQKDRGDVDLPYYAHQGRPGPYQVIDPSDGVQAMLTMLGRLKQGELIGVMGDRAFGDDDNVVDVQFLGSRAWVPFSPYKLASASGATCLVLLTRRIGYQHYEVRLAREIEVPAGLGRDKEAFRYYAQAYARALEDFARDYPWQYFNFYDLWQG